MNITTNKDNLVEALNLASKGLNSRGTLPILEGYKVVIHDNNVSFTATDLNIGITADVKDAQIVADMTESSEQAFVISDGKLFTDMVRKLGSEINIDIKEGKIIVKSGKSVFELITTDVNNFPQLPKVENASSFDIDANILKYMIGKTSYSIASDETRPILKGILFEIKNNEFVTVGLDGFRLAHCFNKVDIDQSIKVVMDGKIVSEVSKLIPSGVVNISFTTNHCLFKFSNCEIVVGLLQGEYINYTQIIPTNFATSAVVNKMEFLNSLERASVFSKESKTNTIRIDINKDSVHLSNNCSLGSFNDELNVRLEGNSLSICFNLKYLIESLKIIEGDEVTLSMNRNVEPIIITSIGDDQSKHLILPIRMVNQEEKAS